MNVEQQKANTNHGDGEAGGTRPAEHGQRQAFTALVQSRALTVSLMEQVCDPKNLLRAYRRVCCHKEKPGGDGVSGHAQDDWRRAHRAGVPASLRGGSYSTPPRPAVLDAS